MDIFGLGKIFDMIEKYYGERITRYFVALISIAISVYAIKIIWNIASPLAIIITNYFFGKPINWESVWENLGRKSVVFVIFLGLIAILFAISAWWVEKASRNLSRDIRATHEETIDILGKVEGIKGESLKNLEEARAALKMAEKRISEHEDRPNEPPASDKEGSQSQ